MSRTATKRRTTTDEYQFDELTDEAKKRARDWYRELIETEDYSEYVIDDAGECAALMGITFDTRDEKLMGGKTIQKPTVYWSGFSSQGDGACFEGRWAADEVKPGKLEEHAPKDTDLHMIADVFERIAKAYPEASFRVKHSGHYYHKYSTSFDCEPGEPGDLVKSRKWKRAYVNVADLLTEDRETAMTNAIDRWRDAFPEDDLIEAARDFMQWIYDKLEAEYEYQSSDEAIEERIRANEYTFTEEGDRS